MTEFDGSMKALTHLRCPGCIAYFQCGSVAVSSVSQLESHLQSVHGWTKTEVNSWLDSSRAPVRAHKGPNAAEQNRPEEPTARVRENERMHMVCGKCHLRMLAGVCRNCSLRPRISGEHEDDLRVWIESLVYEPKRRFARAYVAAYRVHAALPSGAKYGLSLRATSHVVGRLKWMGLR